MTQNPDLIPVLDDAQARRRLSGGSIVLMIGLLAAVLTVGYAMLRNEQHITEGQPVPDFTLTTFDGDEIRLSDLRGQIVVINFWASWCGPCHTEADILQEVSEAYADDGVVLLGLAYRDIPESALDFIDRYAITYANGDGTEIADAYGVQGVPETFIIGPDGRIVENGMILGPVTSGTLYPLLEDLIAAAS